MFDKSCFPKCKITRNEETTEQVTKNDQKKNYRHKEMAMEREIIVTKDDNKQSD